MSQVRNGSEYHAWIDSRRTGGQEHDLHQHGQDKAAVTHEHPMGKGRHQHREAGAPLVNHAFQGG